MGNVQLLIVYLCELFDDIADSVCYLVIISFESLYFRPQDGPSNSKLF